MFTFEWEAEANKIYTLVMEMCPSEDMYVAMNFSIAHIVWEDGNFESKHIESCLKTVEEKDYKRYPDCIEWVIWSLKGLLLLPKYEDCEDYDE